MRGAPSPIHGTGVFAVVDIARGTHIGTYHGRPTDTDGTHVLWVEHGSGWRLTDGTGVLRWLNHSSRPNAEFDGVELYALSRIEAGTEVTIHYGEEWTDVP
ncbi:MAG: SET domain-containing protein [Acidimicrobiales bacterium]